MSKRTEPDWLWTDSEKTSSVKKAKILESINVDIAASATEEYIVVDKSASFMNHDDIAIREGASVNDEPETSLQNGGLRIATWLQQFTKDQQCQSRSPKSEQEVPSLDLDLGKKLMTIRHNIDDYLQTIKSLEQNYSKLKDLQKELDLVNRDKALLITERNGLLKKIETQMKSLEEKNLKIDNQRKIQRKELSCLNLKLSFERERIVRLERILDKNKETIENQRKILLSSNSKLIHEREKVKMLEKTLVENNETIENERKFLLSPNLKDTSGKKCQLKCAKHFEKMLKERDEIIDNQKKELYNLNLNLFQSNFHAQANQQLFWDRMQTANIVAQPNHMGTVQYFHNYVGIPAVPDLSVPRPGYF